MISFRVLGPVSLTGLEGRELRPVTAHRERLALLAMLAIGDAPVRRDALAALLWPALDGAVAGEMLGDAVRAIARAMGAGAVVENGDEIGLAPGAVWCDAVDFRRAIAEDRHEDALSLYAGDLLEGVAADGLGGFDEWLAANRAELRGQAADAALALAERASGAGEWGSAEEWAVFAERVAPADNRMARRLDAVRRASNAGVDADDSEPAVAVLDPPTDSAEQDGGPVRRLEEPGAVRAASTTTGAEIQSESAAPARATRRWGWVPLVAACAVAAAGLWGGYRLLWANRAAVSADDVVAVMPFRTQGADPSLGYLREGMVDLLAARLDGDPGPRALSPQTMIQRWRQAVRSQASDLAQGDAVRVSEELGATELVTGTVEGAAKGVTLTAQVVSVPGGKVMAEEKVNGPADSVPALVDRLAARLLARSPGEGEGRYPSLTSTSLPALKAYLAGQAAYRRGAYAEAVRSFDAALAQDSTLAAAALGLASASIASNGVWTGGNLRARAVPAAWALRDRLTPRDRTFLTAVAGPRYPQNTPMAEHLAAWERAVEADPGRPEAWYELGDMYFHSGAVLGIDDAHERAASAFQRALAVDSTLVTPLQHLADLAIMDGDTAGARRYAALYLARHGQGEAADYVRWRAAAALHDSATLAGVRQRMERMGAQSLFRILSTGLTAADYLADDERAAAILDRRPLSPADRWNALKLQMSLALNRGRPAEAEAALRRMDALGRSARLADVDPMMVTPDRWRMLAALYWDGDAAAGEAAFRRTETALGPLANADDGQPNAEQARDLCVAEQWKVWHGTTSGARRAARMLSRPVAGEPNDPALSDRRWCAQLLSTLVTAMDDSPGADVSLSRFDALMRAGPRPDGFAGVYGNFVLARLFQRRGQVRSALAAARRTWDMPFFISSYLRAEGDLAARMGDQAGSAAAYRRFLNLRAGPEPAFAAEAADIRARLRDQS